MSYLGVRKSHSLPLGQSRSMAIGYTIGIQQEVSSWFLVQSCTTNKTMDFEYLIRSWGQERLPSKLY